MAQPDTITSTVRDPDTGLLSTDEEIEARRKSAEIVKDEPADKEEHDA